MEGLEQMAGWQIFVLNLVIVGTPMAIGFYKQYGTNKSVKDLTANTALLEGEIIKLKKENKDLKDDNIKLRGRVSSLEQENFSKDRKIEELYERLATGGRKGI